MLRGINVSGQKIIKMDDLRKTYESVGFKSVRSYVQSGNILFSSVKEPTLKLSVQIAQIILKEFGFQVGIIVKTGNEMAGVVKNNPFLKEKGIDSARLYVTFLSQIPEKAALKRLDSLLSGQERFYYSGKEIYIHCPDGYGKTKFSNNNVERILETVATTRNWRTVTNLHGMTLKDRSPR